MPKRKGRSTRRTPNYQTFYIQVEDCEPSYSFAVNRSRLHEGPWWEHLEITLSGILLAPDRVKGRRVTAVFLGRREHETMLEQPPSSDWKPLNVGVLTLRGQRTDFLGSLPNDALWGVMHAFSSGGFRIVDLYGVLQRGRAQIQSINFCRAVNLEDEPTASR